MIETSQVMRAALKVVLPLLAIGAAVVAARRRTPNPRETLALTAPDPSATAAWIIVFVALFVGSDVVMHWRGPWDWTPWRDAPLFVSGLFLGAARRQTGSVVPSILMHIAWNLYAIW